MFKGSLTALITPFKGGKVDDGAFQRMVEWQIAEGTHGLVPVGTTGESPTLSHEEHKQVVELCVKVARKRVPVIVPTTTTLAVDAACSAENGPHVQACAGGAALRASVAVVTAIKRSMRSGRVIPCTSRLHYSRKSERLSSTGRNNGRAES